MHRHLKDWLVLWVIWGLVLSPIHSLWASKTDSFTDFSTDLFEPKDQKEGPRNPFEPGAMTEKQDVSSLLLEGIITGPGIKIALVSGKIVSEGDLVGGFLVKNIGPGQLTIQSESGIDNLQIDSYLTRAASGGNYEIVFQNASLKLAIKLIAAAGKFNVVLPEDTQGRVSLIFHDIPLKDALGSILRVNGMDFAEENGIVRVGKTENFPAGTNYSTKTISLNYASAPILVQAIRSHISENGKVTSDDRTNSIIIKDSPAVIDKVSDLIAQLDKSDTEIHIEAKILDVKRNFSRSIGIQWGFTKTDGRVQGFGANSNGSVAGSSNPANVNVPVVNPTSGMGIVIGNVINNTDLEAEITAAEERGDAHIISQPSITTVNNTPAKIRSGLKIYVKTTSSISVGGSGGSASADDSGLQEIDTGIELTVTPQLTAKDTLKLKIDAVESEADFTRTVDNIPAVIDNTASTTVLIKDGETTVIGGMMKVNKSNTSRGVPFISTVPLLGWLFKNKTKSKTDNELLIFITPRIVQKGLARPADSTLETKLPVVEEVNSITVDVADRKKNLYRYKHSR